MEFPPLGQDSRKTSFLTVNIVPSVEFPYTQAWFDSLQKKLKRNNLGCEVKQPTLQSEVA
jgi:hypothetical protein